MNRDRIIIAYKEVFEGQSQDIGTYLAGISKSTCLIAAANLLARFNNDNPDDDYEQIIYDFLGIENFDLGYLVVERIKQHSLKGIPSLVTTESCLKFFEYCYDNIGDIETQAEKDININIFKALLVLNEQTNAEEALSITSTKDVSKCLKVPAPLFSQAYPFFDLEFYRIDTLLTGQLVKGFFLFEFLSNEPQTKILFESFMNYFSCEDGNDYLRRISTIVLPVIGAATHTFIEVPKDHNFQSNCEFLNKISVNSDGEIVDIDFRKTRSNPLLEMEDGKYLVVFRLFLIEKLYKGVYFKLRELNDALPEKDRVGELRSLYSLIFSEQYLFYKILNRIYGNKYIQYTGQELKHIDGAPDYYLRNGNQMFLFESKDIFIDSSIKASYDYNRYRTELEKKLYFKIGKKNKIVNKAILQLVDNIRLALKGELAYDNKYKVKNINIYPILVLYDYQFNTPGLNKILNCWYSDELAKLKDEGLEISKVRPMVIIDIDTLIRYQDLFKDKMIRLENIIDDYFKVVQFDYNKKYQDQQHAINELKYTLISFPMYLRKIVEKRRLVKVPTLLSEIGLSLVNSNN